MIKLDMVLYEPIEEGSEQDLFGVDPAYDIVEVYLRPKDISMVYNIAEQEKTVGVEVSKVYIYIGTRGNDHFFYSTYSAKEIFNMITKYESKGFLWN